MVNRRQIQNQQMILKALGFYIGKCDGIWSERTIEAKKEFEADSSFKPAYPNSGMPFELGPSDKLPAGIYADPRNRGFLKHDDLTDEREREWSKELPDVYDNRKDSIKTEEPRRERTEEEPKVVEQEPVDDELELDAETESTPQAQQATNQHNKKRQKKGRLPG